MNDEGILYISTSFGSVAVIQFDRKLLRLKLLATYIDTCMDLPSSSSASASSASSLENDIGLPNNAFVSLSIPSRYKERDRDIDRIERRDRVDRDRHVIGGDNDGRLFVYRYEEKMERMRDKDEEEEKERPEETEEEEEEEEEEG